MSQGLWLSNEVFEESRKLDILMFGLKQGDEISSGEGNYEAIATIRQELERLMAKDMLNLHDVRGFLQSKDKPDPGFSPIMLQRLVASNLADSLGAGRSFAKTQRMGDPPALVFINWTPQWIQRG